MHLQTLLCAFTDLLVSERLLIRVKNMALVAHSDMELNQMDIKTAFLNGNIEEEIYMVQPENIEAKDSQHMICKLKKFIYGIK